MEKLVHATDEAWNKVEKFNRDMLQDFLMNSAELSPKTRQIYESNLRIWMVWVCEHLNNKKQIDVTPLDYKKFQNWMVYRGCSSADTNNKRAAISSLNNYIEIYYHDEYPLFRNFINKSIKRPAKKIVRDKKPLTKKEFSDLIEKLREQEEYQKVAYLLFTFETGCRRAASRQLLKSVVNAEPIHKQKKKEDEDGNEVLEDVVIYQTHPIREKGAGEQGKVRRLVFGEGAMAALKDWMNVRGEDDCPYMFVTKHGEEVRQVGETTFNAWFKSTFSPIVGRSLHPHDIRASRATQAVVEDGKDVEAVKQLLGHESQTTTLQYYIVKDENDAVDELF